jgi:hypothetical protein
VTPPLEDVVVDARADAEAFRCHPDCGICNACALAARIDALGDEVKRLRLALGDELRP